jgi:hypothetical protein
MAATLVSASDAILSTLKTAWDANAGTIVGGSTPTLVYEALEPDLKPHPRDTGSAWARVVLRHQDSEKVTLNNSDRAARYRRYGLVWVQVFTPRKGAADYTVAQELAAMVRLAFEGRRAAGDAVCFKRATVMDVPPEGSWWRFDVKVDFYWDEIHA